MIQSINKLINNCKYIKVLFICLFIYPLIFSFHYLILLIYLFTYSKSTYMSMENNKKHPAITCRLYKFAMEITEYKLDLFVIHLCLYIYTACFFMLY